MESHLALFNQTTTFLALSLALIVILWPGFIEFHGRRN